MKTQNLLSQLTNLEGQLNHFSFEELTSEEASLLKKSFVSFKSRLEEKVLGPNTNGSSLYGDGQRLHLTQEGNDLARNPQERRVYTEASLLTGVGKEIKSPVDSILKSVDVLKESDLSIRQLQQLKAISGSSNYLLEITNELLEYAKLSKGQEPNGEMDFNFHSIIKDTLYLCNTLILNKEVRLQLEMDDDIPETLSGDPSKLSQILLTLLGNIIKGMNQGHICLKLRVQQQHAKHCALEFIITESRQGNRANGLSSTNDGVKPEQYQDTLATGSTLLSLEIAKQTIKNLNGYMTLPQGHKTAWTHKFTIPFSKVQYGSDAVAKYDAEYLEKASKEIAEMHVLVFEDNILIQKLMEQRLKKWGCKVLVTDSGAKGINYLQDQKVDLVLVDIEMPMMNGFKIAQSIREFAVNSGKDLSIVALSREFSSSHIRRCKAMGITEYIKKPYSPDQLLASLYKCKNDLDSKALLSNNKNTDLYPLDIDLCSVNLSNILEECMGEIDLLEELIVLFKQNILEFIGKANIYIPQRNFNKLGFAAHKVKTGLSMMKAHGLYALVNKIIVCCKTNQDSKSVEFLYNQILKAYPMVEKAIDNQLESLKNNRN